MALNPSPSLSSHFLQVGVSWEEAHPLSVAHGTRLTLTASSPTIAYVRQTAALPASELAAGSAVAAPGPAGTSSRGLLILQRLLDPSLDPSDVPRRGSGGADAADGDDDDEVWAPRVVHT